ncbi:MAG: FG-GAP-like repeat-containing protein [Candidatus Eisenbacteria bacterium]
MATNPSAAHAAFPTTPMTVIDGTQDGAELGWSVATAGDVNGDGYSDVIAGEIHYSGANGTNSGRAKLFLGGPGGPDAVADWSVEGSAGSQFGYCVAPAGDVNGDGYADVLVGAPYLSNGSAAEGRAYLFLGGSGGLSVSPAWTFESNQADANCGYSVGTAGDVNGDGYDDVIVGAKGYTNTQSHQGRVYVFHGGAGGLGGSPAQTLNGIAADDAFGFSVSTAGDVNADGYADILIGAPYQNVLFGPPNGGAVWCFHGSASGVDSGLDWIYQGSQQDEYLGSSVALAGDANGDGYSDILIGAVGWDSGQNDAGRVLFFRGGVGGLESSPLRTYQGTQLAEALGNSVAPCGDVNGDGYADIVLGEPNRDIDQPDEGAVIAYYGSVLGPPSTAFALIHPSVANSGLGFSVQTAGDVDGDGFSDLIAGAPFFDNGHFNRGRILIYRGGADLYMLASGFEAQANSAGARLGTSVAYVDANGDGYSDLLVGAPQYDGTGTWLGRSYCWYGGPDGASTGSPWVVTGVDDGLQLGSAICSAGDTDGDGYEDVLVSGPGFDHGVSNQGIVYLYRGSAAGLAATPSWSAAGGEAVAGFGTDVASAGDVNGDGFGDVVVGMPLHDSSRGVDAGGAVLYFGSASGLTTTGKIVFKADQATAHLGFSVASCDVNGDGYSDVLCGAPDYDDGQTDEGAVFVYYGNPVGMSTTPSQILQRNIGGAGFGYSVSSAGDVNADGYGDVIVGSPYVSPGGSASVYLGSPSGLGAAPVFTYNASASVGGHFGNAVASSGDVNRDGYGDVVVGAPSYSGSQGRIFVFLGTATGVEFAYRFANEGSAAGDSYGTALAGAGDMDGDGFPDLAVGSPLFTNGQALEGLVSLYYGNRYPSGFDIAGIDVVPFQVRRDGSAPIALLGMSESSTGLQFGAYLRSPLGRADVRLDWDMEPLGSPGWVDLRTAPQWYDSGPTGGGGIGSRIHFQGVIEGLQAGELYHWRMRTRTRSPFFPHSPWISIPGNAATEGDLRMHGAPTDAPEIAQLEDGLRIESIRPNPSPHGAAIRFRMPTAGAMRLDVHDVAGRRVASLGERTLEAGAHTVDWDGRDGDGRPLSSGVYFLRLQMGDEESRARIVISR